MNEQAIELIESTANMLRGMVLDPAIPVHAKAAMVSRIADLDTFVERATNPICDACQKPIFDYQKNVGHECDLHEQCADFTVPDNRKD